MLPPIKYKIHPKMAEILQDKRRRRQILNQAREKEIQERQILKEGRKEYIQENKKQIARKVQQMYEKKVIKHNVIREQQKQRPMRIAVKKSERLMRLVPERRQLIQALREHYLENIRTNDHAKQEKLQQIIEARIVKPQLEFKLQEKVRQHNLIDTNDGICVICLTSEAHLYMIECKHLISCKDCQFILRLQKKCPLCRKVSNYADLKLIKKRRVSLQK